MTIRQKLNLLVVFSMAFSIMACAVLFWAFQQLKEKREESRFAGTIIRNVFELNTLTNDYLLHHRKRAKRQWLTKYDTTKKALEEIELDDPDKQSLLLDIRRNLEHIGELFPKLATISSIPETEQTNPLSRNLQHRLESQLLLKSQNMVTDASRMVAISEKELSSFQKMASRVTLALIGVFAVVIAAFFFLVRQSVIQPIGKLHEGVERIGAGELEFCVGTETRDEIGLFSRAFDDMVERLKTAMVSRDELGKSVDERTADLTDANARLQEENEVRKRAEAALREAISEIETLKDRLQRENISLREEIELKHTHKEIVGQSDAVNQVLSQAEQAAESGSTVLILGETGTGKELLAQAIHRMSIRKDRPIVTVNCAALPATLIEAELFGREKGAYTGALSKQAGRFEVADGSTIFLDEIGELTLDLQAKLLRVLEDGQFERLGSSETIKVDVRVIAATNRDLATDVREGRFREDLYYRLNVFPITLPPLRERQEDISLLVWAFVREFSESMGQKIEGIPQKSLEALNRYPWPGNVRELKNVVERSMILSKGSPTLQIQLSKAMNAEATRNLTLEEVERRHILDVLDKTGWRVRGQNGAAEILGVKPTTLEARMKKLGIEREPRTSNIS